MSIVSKKLSYFPQLDSLRFFAVLLVILHHWLPNTKINIIPNGFLGVNIFFVLSGFLISSNLLYRKIELDTRSLSFGHAIKSFFIRRTLRIFPLYFIVLFLMLISVPSVFNGHFTWYILYIPNFLVYKLHSWPGMLSHFWSLGVEEQFYLIWPFLILFCPWKFLKYLFPSIVLVSIGFKLSLFKFGGSFFNYYDALPISCFDAFGMGALLALFRIENNEFLSSIIFRIPVWLGFITTGLLAGLVYVSGLSFLFGLVVSFGSFYFIIKTLEGYKGILAWIFNQPTLQYLGKISYGLYVYHNFIPWLVRCITGQETEYPLHLPIIKADWLHGAGPFFIVHFLLLICISSISWFLIEKPINNFKKHFV